MILIWFYFSGLFKQDYTGKKYIYLATGYWSQSRAAVKEKKSIDLTEDDDEFTLGLTTRQPMRVILRQNGMSTWFYLIDSDVLGFNNTSTLVDHFVSSPRERERRAIYDWKIVESDVKPKSNKNKSHHENMPI